MASGERGEGAYLQAPPLPCSQLRGGFKCGALVLTPLGDGVVLVSCGGVGCKRVGALRDAGRRLSARTHG